MYFLSDNGISVLPDISHVTNVVFITHSVIHFRYPWIMVSNMYFAEK